MEQIAKDNPRAAATLADRVFTLVDRLAAGEFDGPEHWLYNGQLVRSWPVPPLRLYYQRLPKELQSFASTTIPDGQLLAKPDRFCFGDKQSSLTFVSAFAGTLPLAMKIALAPTPFFVGVLVRCHDMGSSTVPGHR